MALTAYGKGWRAIQLMLRDGRSWSGRERNCMFLNTHGEQCANISAISGVDFLDDGRGLARVDWDHDGDLDFWVSCRTGPMLRFLRNDYDSDNHFLAVRLVGTTCNRDAIGARIELHLAGMASSKMVRTLRAGDSYLSQSSKWVHFGLGQTEKIDKLVVHWPGGNTQEVTGIQADRRIEVVEADGSFSTQTEHPRDIVLAPELLTEKEPAVRQRTFIRNRKEVPFLDYLDRNGRSQMVNASGGSPLLIVVWASWCAPCLTELHELSQATEQIHAAGLKIVAVNVDEVANHDQSDPNKVTEILSELKFPFSSGVGTAYTVETLERLPQLTFGTTMPLALPSSFLIDSKNELAVIYTGAVSVDQLLKDVAFLELPSDRLPAGARAFAGQWIEEQRVTEVSAATDSANSLLVVCAGICLLCVVFGIWLIRVRRANASQP